MIHNNHLHVTGAVNAQTGQPKANSCQCSEKPKPALTSDFVSWLNAQRSRSELLSDDFVAYATRQAKGGQ